MTILCIYTRGQLARAQTAQPVKLGLGHGMLLGITRNRRAGTLPWLKHDSIDPHLGIVRVDKLDGTPLATLWFVLSQRITVCRHHLIFGCDGIRAMDHMYRNFATHGYAIVRSTFSIFFTGCLMYSEWCIV